jgi:hypothetical protein
MGLDIDIEGKRWAGTTDKQQKAGQRDGGNNGNLHGKKSFKLK